ncbi:uncharacterized protein LOC129793705 isoform X2 [Lutzomyia longipalpis]|uniref:uncharacterized protein LOC129793705 isoform X2 n=1 Tax=Lutzomyia longipalpis TaxID=7200 RepID=UPI002483563E|nr:uncharacterized protein LOC129793705 isoform X2 [Lutzomyia longipalpis]
MSVKSAKNRAQKIYSTIFCFFFLQQIDPTSARPVAKALLGIGGSGLLGGLGLGGARTTTGANGTAGSGNQGVQINVGLQNGSVKGAGTGSSSASEADSGTINSYDLVLGPLSYEELDTNYILAPEFVTLEKEGFTISGSGDFVLNVTI